MSSVLWKCTHLFHLSSRKVMCDVSSPSLLFIMSIALERYLWPSWTMALRCLYSAFSGVDSLALFLRKKLKENPPRLGEGASSAIPGSGPAVSDSEEVIKVIDAGNKQV